ncbi:hypothetical protein F5887DRAFT_1075444 [Amanita rubescens]|nr:hypothetical protein F5887DRAFT_1075444 [Amanita rubescens]
MARKKSWHWDHFHKAESKANQTHWNATCNYCTKNELGRLELEEQVALDAGSISHARSKDVLIGEARAKVNFTTGKLTVMNNHLLSCDYVPTSVQNLASKHKNPNGTESDDSDVTSGLSGLGKTQAPKWSRPADGPGQGQTEKKQKTFTVIATKHTPFTQKTQASFNHQLLRAWISAGFSFNSIEDPEVRKLFHDFIPGATVPHRC